MPAGIGHHVIVDRRVDAGDGQTSRARVPPRLRPPQPGVASVAGQQIFVRPLLDHASVIEHQDEIGVADRGETVGDDQVRAACEQRRQRFLHLPLGDGIECARRLVENEDARILQDGARDRQPLPLAAGEAITAFADHGVVSVGQRSDGVVDLRTPGGILDVRPRRVGTSVSQVLS